MYFIVVIIIIIIIFIINIIIIINYYYYYWSDDHFTPWQAEWNESNDDTKFFKSMWNLKLKIQQLLCFSLPSITAVDLIENKSNRVKKSVQIPYMFVSVILIDGSKTRQ